MVRSTFVIACAFVLVLAVAYAGANAAQPHAPETVARRVASPPPSPEPTAAPTLAPTPAPPAPAETPSPSAPPASASAVPAAPVTSPAASPAPAGTPTAQPSIRDSLGDGQFRNALGRPIAELSKLRWLVGTWKAKARGIAANSKSREAVTTYVFGRTMNDRWIFGADGRSSNYLYLTFDPFVERWTLLRVASEPAYGIWLSDDGWRGNRIEFVSAAAFALGRSYRRRLTIVQKNARAFTILDDEQLADGSWSSDSTIEFTKEP